MWRSLFQASQLDRELDDELEGYLEELITRHVNSGNDRTTARRKALVEMGGVHSIRQEVRRGRFGTTLETTLGDVRYAWRGLQRSPGVALVIIMTLALGIGANTAIFSVVHAMLLSPLPLRDSSRLVFVWSDMSDAGYPRAPLSGPELNDLRERNTRFDGFGAIWSNTAALDGESEPEQLRIGLVTVDFFSTLGAAPALGRVFSAEDAQVGGPTTIVLSDALWRRRYGSDPTLVGRQIRVNGRPTTVIGVMAKDFRLFMPPDSAVPDDLQAWLPFGPGLVRGPRGQQFLRVIGRMKSGVTLEHARADVDRIAADISHAFSGYGPNGRRFTTVGLHADNVRELRRPLLALFGGVLILLLVACVNVASILLARAAARSGETALRLALGAGLSRLLRQYFVEGLVLATLGAAAGIAVASAVLRVLVLMVPASLGRIALTRIDSTVLVFTSMVALAWGLLFSLAPLAQARRANLAGVFQAQRARVSAGLHQRTRTALVVAQLALSVVLLVGAVLLARSFVHIIRVDPGFRSSGVMTFRVALPPARYGEGDAENVFSRQLQQKLLAIPGVTGAGAISHVPFDTVPNWGGPYLAETIADDSRGPHADYRAVTPGLMEALGIELLAGRFFDERDDRRGQPVVIVDDLLASRTWPGQSAIGRKLAADPFSQGKAQVAATVVGVVRHVRYRSLLEDLSEQVFFPQRQILRNPVAYMVRTSGDPAEIAPDIRRVVASLDPQLPIADVRPLDRYTADARAATKFTLILAATFAVVALLLGSVGVYGVIAYSVSRRRTEFGVRLALGAAPGQILSAAMSEGVRAAALGLTLGVAAAALVAPRLDSELFGVSAHDAISYVVAAAVLAAAGLMAAWLPARRAARIRPIDALRVD
jgi:putative ABC transport system permease protein